MSNVCVYVNSSGYHITGEGIKVASHCIRSRDKDGVPFYSDLQHMYAVLVRALNDLRGRDLKGEVVLYNDTRIIDELNGVVPAIDELCREFCLAIRREILPNVGAVVFFRKADKTKIDNIVQEAHDTMIAVEGKRDKIAKLVKKEEEHRRSNKVRALHRLQEMVKRNERNK